jgi:hypothetical protein
MHHCPITNQSLGDKPKDGAFQAGNATCGAEGVAVFEVDFIAFDISGPTGGVRLFELNCVRK